MKTPNQSKECGLLGFDVHNLSHVYNHNHFDQISMNALIIEIFQMKIGFYFTSSKWDSLRIKMKEQYQE